MNKEQFNEFWESMTPEEKIVFVSKHLKTLSKWDLKRILCDVLGVDGYMDDEGLKKALESVANER